MKRILFIIISLLFLIYQSEGAQAQNSNYDISGKLVKGKWLNRCGGYVPNAFGKSDRRVKRLKIIEFKEDGTFIMDSVKMHFTGKWKVINKGSENAKVIIRFKPRTIVHYHKNTDPNSTSYKYATTKETVSLGEREGFIKDKILEFNDGVKFKNYSGAIVGILSFFEFSGFANANLGYIIMIFIGIFFIFLGIKFNYEPLLLVPIGVGILIGNIPMFQAQDFNLKLGIYEPGSVMNYLYSGVIQGWYPPLIFLGIGAMTDFSSLISNPRLMLLGAAAQLGIFVTFLGALALGFAPPEAGAIGIIGGADGPTAIFLSSKLANGINVMANGQTVKNLIGPIAIAAYSYMALVPLIQPPIIKLLTTKKERKIHMNPPRAVSKLEKIMFPVVALLVTGYIAPTSLPLLGMLFFGNLLKESGVTKRLANTASNALIDIVTIVLGLTVGASTQADVFLTSDSILIFVLGALSFMIATVGGVIFGKLMNWFSRKGHPVNPMIGAAGVSAVPDSARVVQTLGLEADPSNHLLMHAMAPNVAGVIGSAVGAGILLGFLL